VRAYHAAIAIQGNNDQAGLDRPSLSVLRIRKRLQASLDMVIVTSLDTFE
jgi:hypothetical protein